MNDGKRVKDDKKRADCNWGDPGDRKNNHGHMTLIDKIRALDFGLYWL
jgi:hypothetical protein